MSASASKTIVYARLVVDGTGRPPIENGAARIEGTKIAAVGPAAALAPAPGEVVTEIDLRPHTVIPGLIDVHTHLGLAGDGRGYEDMALDSDEMMVLAGVMNLQKHLRAGVTTVRDNGERNRVGFALREGIERGYVVGPRLLACGRPITCTGGHFHWCNEVADGADEIRRSVRRLVHEGADHIKIMASGGGTRGTVPGRPSYSVEELHAASHEAHTLGRLTVAHSYDTTPKGNKPRHLRLPKTVAPYLLAWSAECPPTNPGLVFPILPILAESKPGRPHMGRAQDMLGLPELLSAAGLRPLTRPWHTLRHTFASHYVMNGGNILALQKILGHSDVKMTLIYAHLAPDYLADEMERVKF